MLDEYQENRVTVTRIDIPFGSLVMLFTKAAIAAIPAAILTTIIITGVALAVTIFGGGVVAAIRASLQ